MKNFLIFILFAFPIFYMEINPIFSQTFCGAENLLGENDNPHSLRGGFYKPATSNIGGAPEGEDYFPVLVVFVQFKNEPGDSTTTNFDSWPARKKPNYFDSIIAKQRLSSSDWWNSYNNYAISDYWHEFSRGKLHVYGRAEFIILSRELQNYNSLAIINKEIYDTLKVRLGRKWLDYDRWKYISDGQFAWQKDSLVDMIYTVFRQGNIFLYGYFDGGISSIGPIDGIDTAYTVFNNDSGDVAKVFFSLGDRWDAWNVGYNEVFSPYSSPNTNAMNNDNTGIFVWYKQLDASNNKATINIYRASENGGTLSRDSILHLTPPSRPMGIRIENYSTNVNFCYPKIVWNHNMEPDMIRAGNVKRYNVYKAAGTNMSAVPTRYSLLVTTDIHKDSTAYFIDLSVNKYDCSSFGIPPYGTQYPVRYYVKAVDKFNDESVPSDFAKTEGVTEGGHDPIGPDNLAISNSNIPTEYSLKQNYPNPFNPNTNIQYDLPFDNFVTIRIYDILGKEVMILVNEFKPAGSYVIGLNGSFLSSGIYFYKIDAGNFKEVRQMVLIK